MKKFMSALVLSALFVVSGMAWNGFNTTATAEAAQKCDAIGYHGRNGKQNYTVNGNTATIKFKVTGPENCKLPVTIVSWKAPSANGRPYNKQVLYQHKTQVFTQGQNRTLSIQLPACYYQVDTLTGTKLTGSTNQPHKYGSRMVGFLIGGNKSCTPPAKPPVTPPATPPAVTQVPEPPAPEPPVEVAETPEEEPKELVEVGSTTNTLATILAVSTIGGYGYSRLRARRHNG